jgi:hypothetical protein
MSSVPLQSIAQGICRHLPGVDVLAFEGRGQRIPRSPSDLHQTLGSETEAILIAQRFDHVWHGQ